jgi:hypothetical protein
VQVTVVLKHLFTPDEAAEAGSSFATEMEADVTAECKKLGTIEKVSTATPTPFSPPVSGYVVCSANMGWGGVATPQRTRQM